MEDGLGWYETILQATDAAKTQDVPQIQGGSDLPSSRKEKVEDDDDYWASYDRTPGRTPAPKHSPAPQAMSSSQPADGQRSQAEQDYYSRYGTEVQPAMDGHDPDEDHPEIGESTLNGGSLVQSQPQAQPSTGHVSRPNGASMFPADPPSEQPAGDVEAPRPISPTSSNGSSVERLETKAAEMSEALSLGGNGYRRGHDRAQMAVKQHISTDIKSLFRLAKSSGMEREEFDRIVRTELDCLSMMEQDE